MCVRMFEPPEESSIGRLTVDLGVETVQGTAGIVMLLQHCMSIVICLIHRWK